MFGNGGFQSLRAEPIQLLTTSHQTQTKAPTFLTYTFGFVLEFGRRCIRRRLVETTLLSYELGQNIVAIKL